jgi:primosomal protein N' (replication factor Y) (superfamily II helicase)
MAPRAGGSIAASGSERGAERGRTGGAAASGTSTRGAAQRKRAGSRVPAAELPVARVLVDMPLAHLDRPFDYLVPQRLSAAASAGCRVRIRFAGQLTDGYLLERAAASEHPGKLAYLERVVSPEAVLTQEIAGLARAVADRYAGTMADVLRLAIPPRHAGAEAAAPPAGDHPGPLAPPGPGPWAQYPAGPSFLTAIADGRAPRAAWSALPGPDWPEAIATAAAAAQAARPARGAVIVVPDTRDLARADAALTAALGPGRHVTLTADLGPAERYRRWLAVLRGSVQVAAGTRAAMFAPVRDLGLVVLWDDGDDLHAEPRAPYPHAREVLALRAHRCGAGALIGGIARTAEMTQLVTAGWAHPLAADRATVRSRAPAIRAAGDEAELARDESALTARLPSLALRTAQQAISAGPVLVQVPRRGYLAAIGCGRCRAPVRCGHCGGPLELPSRDGVAHCRWCGRPAPLATWQCPACSFTAVRALVTGARRTAEELGRAFPSVRVRTSAGGAAIRSVPDSPALVVATPGAEPPADRGYAAALLLDGWALLGRPDLRAAEETLRRWLNAAALVRPARDGGAVVVLADVALPAAQALIRWDPVGHSERELAERAELRFPPCARMASITGAPGAIRDVTEILALPPGGEILGPVAVNSAGGPPGAGENTEDHGRGGDERALVRVPRTAGAQLARALREAQAARTARKAPDPVRVQLDPLELV